jgi:hypothetical protein
MSARVSRAECSAAEHGIEDAKAGGGERAAPNVAAVEPTERVLPTAFWASPAGGMGRPQTSSWPEGAWSRRSDSAAR